MIVEPKLECGICIEILEYHDTLTIWGLCNNGCVG
ncbi:YxiF family protein [Fictibacillus phosphorivorans]